MERRGVIDEDEADATLNIRCQALESKAREYEIDDLRGFYKSRMFSANGFELDEGNNSIVYAR